MNSKQLRTFLEVVLQIASRLICVGSLIWLGLIVADNSVLATRWSDATTSSNHECRQATRIPDLLTIADGYWTFDGTELATQRVICGHDELEQRLSSLNAIDSGVVTSKRSATHLVALAESNGAIRSECLAGILWTVDKPDLQLRLLTSHSATPELIGAASAFRDNDRWELTILQPRPLAQDHLLPLPAESKTICTRRSDSGQLQIELVSISQPNEQLLKQWRSEGWEIQHAPWAAEDRFALLCARGEAVVYAWSEQLTGSRTIMLSSATSGLASENLAKVTR